MAFDLFVAHAAADRAFVHGFLLPALGLPAEKVRLTGERAPSPEAIAALEEEVEVSRVILVVLTPAFLADPWAQCTERWASHVAIHAERSVIPLVLQRCQVPLHLRANVELDFRDAEEWEEEVERLRKLFAHPPPLEPELPCPYPGMRPFAAGDAAHFHGRGREVEELSRRLAAGEQELYVIGPSGCGKSSLIYAGLLPRLEASADNGGAPRFVVRTFRPGDSPMARLGAALEAEGSSDDVEAAVTALLAKVRKPDTGSESASLLLFIDQLEELFALATSVEHIRFAAAIAALRKDPRVTLLLALRADFFAELMQSALWVEHGIRQLGVAPLRGQALRDAIERPARDAGVFLEPALVERLLIDTAASPGALPLMQETLVQLWERRRRRLLPLAEYQSLGDAERSGLAIAISRRADRCLEELSPAQQLLARRTFLRLVSFGEGRPDTRRQQPFSALRGAETAAELRAVLAALAAARLIIMDAGARPRASCAAAADPSTSPVISASRVSSDDRVDLVHEALITAWPPLAEWIKVRRSDEEHRRRLELRAAHWVSRGRGAGGLLDAEELVAARAWRRSAAAAELGESADITALLTASDHHLHQERRQRARRTAAAAAVLLAFTALAIVLAIFARAKARDAVEQSRVAGELLVASYQDAARQLIRDGRPRQALPYLVAARERGVDTPALRLLYHRATANPLLTSLPHSGAVNMMHLLGDDRRLITASDDQLARIWDLDTGALLRTLPHAGRVLDLSVPEGESTIVAATDRGDVWTWDTESGALRDVRRGLGPPELTLVALDPTGRHLAIGGFTQGEYGATDFHVRLWNLADPSLPPFVVDRGIHPTSARFSDDGSRVVIVGTGGSVRVWSTATGALEMQIADGSERGAMFTADRDQVVVMSDQAIRVWSLFLGGPTGVPSHHGDRLEGFAVDYEARLLATYGVDNKARVWNILGHEVSPPLPHGASIKAAAFDRKGNYLATGGDDRTARIWDVSTGLAMTAPLEHDTSVDYVAFTNDGGRLLTVGADRTVRVWDARPHAEEIGTASLRSRRDPALTLPTLVSLFLGHRYPLVAFRVSGDGERLLSASLDGEVRIWDAASGRRRLTLRHGDEQLTSARFDDSDTLVVTTGRDNVARIWSLSTGAQLCPALQHPGNVVDAMFYPGGALVFTAAEDGARVWDTSTGKLLLEILSPQAGELYQIEALSPAGLITTSVNGPRRHWDVGLDASPLSEWRARAAASGFVLEAGALVERDRR